MNQPEGLSFGWYLYIFTTILRGDEPTFWRTMTPFRVMTLYRAHQRMGRASNARDPLTAPRSVPAAAPAPQEEKPASLFAYITGKGG